MAIDFTKWQGCGNDFVLIEDMDERVADASKLAARICDRHFGIGADGLILLLPSDSADLKMRIFNADGSEAEMCGNGIRCFSRLAYERGIVTRGEFSVETGAGILRPRIVKERDAIVGVCVDMGEPRLLSREIPAVDFVGIGENDRVVGVQMKVDGAGFRVTCVSMGNPHCVVFIAENGYDDIMSFPIERFGPLFERDAHFPRKTNTEFVKVIDRSHLRMRVWERGAAVTLACGTGACATLVAASLNNLADKKADIGLDGGTLHVEWKGDNHVYMTGPAEKVFEGRFE
ncbi:MAG: diaminopimelate epimerase [Schwartzia sp.]|nr:diaminopimelate epimerase [Schwartzia sp. (in: firmicutes)]